MSALWFRIVLIALAALLLLALCAPPVTSAALEVRAPQVKKHIFAPKKKAPPKKAPKKKSTKKLVKIKTTHAHKGKPTALPTQAKGQAYGLKKTAKGTRSASPHKTKSTNLKAALPSKTPRTRDASPTRTRSRSSSPTRSPRTRGRSPTRTKTVELETTVATP